MKRADVFKTQMILGLLLGLLVVGGASVSLSNQLGREVFMKLGVCMLVAGMVIGVLTMAMSAMRYGAARGLRYAYTNYRIVRGVRRSMYDAGICVLRNYGDIKLGVTPKVKLKLEPGMERGILKVKNEASWYKRLLEVFMGAALPGNYVVTRHYVTDNGNYVIFEIELANTKQRVISSIGEFVKYARQASFYELILDDRYIIDISSILCIGMTGNGKSYLIYNILLQALCKVKDWIVYTMDPKQSGVFALARKTNPLRAAAEIDDIIGLIRQIGEQMYERKRQFYEKVSGKIDADFREFGFVPIVAIIDEFSSLMAALSRYDKATRDEIMTILGDVVRMGRQIGVFLIIAQQKTDANSLSTEMRENIQTKIILGNCERQTYITALGQVPENADRRYEKGQGLLVSPGIATVDHPVTINTPQLTFSISEAVDTMTRGGTAGGM